MKKITEIMEQASSAKKKALEKLVDAYYECFDEYTGDKDYIEVHMDLIVDFLNELGEDQQAGLAIENIVRRRLLEK